MASNLLFAVYDLKAKHFWPPYVSVTAATGIREFGDLVASERTPLGKHPEDYVLYQVGTFDDVQGVVESQKHVPMAKATEFASALIPELSVADLTGNPRVNDLRVAR